MVQVNKPYTTVRIKFRKVGHLQYISHLDLVRTMQKVLKRAKLPLWYTEGFNPKPKMTFSPPLSTGVESETEFLDVRLTELLPLDEIKARLNANLTDELRVLDVYLPESSLSDIGWFTYVIEIHDSQSPEIIIPKIEDFLSKEEININKKSKKGEVIQNIKPLIKNVCISCGGDTVRLTADLSASSEQFLNPENLIKAMREEIGILSSDNPLSEHYTTVRERAFYKDMTDFC